MFDVFRYVFTEFFHQNFRVKFGYSRVSELTSRAYAKKIVAPSTFFVIFVHTLALATI